MLRRAALRSSSLAGAPMRRAPAATLQLSHRDPIPTPIPQFKIPSRHFLDLHKMGNKEAIKKERARISDELSRGYFADLSEIRQNGGKVTFFSSESLPPDFSHVVKFGEITYSLYSHSFLHLGQNVAYESLRELLSSRDPKTSADSVQGRIFKDPCTPKGYVHHVESLEPSLVALHSDAEYHPIAHAIGNFSECKSAALMLLQKGKDECLYPHCPLGPTFIPKLQGRFLATENFFYTSKFFGLGSTSFLRDLMSAGEQFCEEDWSTLKKKYHDLDDDDLVRYCFSSAYIVALLHDSLGVAVDDNRIEFAHQVGGVVLDWALGAFIIQKTSVQISTQAHWIASIVKGDSSAVVSLLSISALLIFIAWSLRKWRKPQSKTIFDLEKGRYITVHYRT